MKTTVSKLEMLRNVRFTLTTNTDLLYPISNDILDYNKCLEKINSVQDTQPEIRNPESVKLLRKAILPDFKFIASVLRSYAVMTNQAEILCNCKLKESNIEAMSIKELAANFCCYLNFCRENINFLQILGLTGEKLHQMENTLKEVNSILNNNSIPSSFSEVNKILDEAQRILERRIDNYIEERKKECPHLYKEYIKARHPLIEESNLLQIA